MYEVVCICAYVSLCVYLQAMCAQVLCVRTYLYMQALIHMYASHVHVCARLYMYVQAHICMIPLCVCMCVRVQTYVHICMQPHTQLKFHLVLCTVIIPTMTSPNGSQSVLDFLDSYKQLSGDNKTVKFRRNC